MCDLSRIAPAAETGDAVYFVNFAPDSTWNTGRATMADPQFSPLAGRGTVAEGGGGGGVELRIRFEGADLAGVRLAVPRRRRRLFPGVTFL